MQAVGCSLEFDYLNVCFGVLLIQWRGLDFVFWFTNNTLMTPLVEYSNFDDIINLSTLTKSSIYHLWWHHQFVNFDDIINFSTLMTSSIFQLWWHHQFFNFDDIMFFFSTLITSSYVSTLIKSSYVSTLLTSSYLSRQLNKFCPS